MSLPSPGQQAPDFTTTDEAGNSRALKDLRGKKVVLYFYPKDSTSGCTMQACDFRDNYKHFAKKGAVILGVSPDPKKAHDKFKLKYEIPFPLLLDEDKVIANKYGVWKEKSMYGRKFMGIERTTFIIDEQGKISHVFPKVRVAEHVLAVLEALNQP